MTIQQTPRIGTWYVNMTGKLMKVRMLLYFHGVLSAVAIEYLDGHNALIQVDDWNCLDLSQHGMGSAAVSGTESSETLR